MSAPRGNAVITRHRHMAYVGEETQAVSEPQFHFIPRVGRYAHVANQSTRNSP